MGNKQEASQELSSSNDVNWEPVAKRLSLALLIGNTIGLIVLFIILIVT